VSYYEDMTITYKKEKITTIDNAKLLEPYHDLRLKDVVFNENFIVIPKT